MESGNDKYKQIVENLPYGFARHRIVKDARGKPVDYVFLEVNRAFEQATGLSRESIIGKRATDVLPGIEHSRFSWIDKYGKVAENGTRITLEQFSEPLQRYYEVTAYSDEKDHFVTVFSDITEKKRLDDSLRYYNDRMRLLLDVSEAIAAEKSAVSLSQVIVDGIARLTGLKSAAIYLVEGQELYLEATYPPLPPQFPEHLRTAPLAEHPHIAHALSTRQPVVLEDSLAADLTAAEREVCELRHLRSILYLPLVHQGRSIGVLIPCSIEVLHHFSPDDIDLCQTLASNAALAIVEARLAEEKQRYITWIEKQNRNLEQAERSARESQQRVADIMRYAENVAFVITDAHPEDPRIIDFSAGAETIFGYKKEEIIGKKVSILHRKAEVKQFSRVMQAMSHHKPGFSGEAVLVRQSGEHFPALFRTYPLFDDQGKMWGTVGITVDITERKQAEDALIETLQRYRRGLEGTIHSMGILMGKRDNYTAEHQVRVARLAVAIARELGLEEETIEGVKLAAEIHDIGKIGIPAEILTTPRPLTDLEYQLLQTHPATGYEILCSIDFPWPLARIIEQHHERTDGSGYPQGLLKEDIMLEARIICVADVVEAMSSHRPYRPARGIDTALAEVADNRGVLYDADVVDVCLRLFREKGFQFES